MKKYQTFNKSAYSYVPATGKTDMKYKFSSGGAMKKYQDIKGGYQDVAMPGGEMGMKDASKMDKMSKAAKTKAKNMIVEKMRNTFNAKTSQSMGYGNKDSYSVGGPMGRVLKPKKGM